VVDGIENPGRVVQSWISSANPGLNITWYFSLCIFGGGLSVDYACQEHNVPSHHERTDRKSYLVQIYKLESVCLFQKSEHSN
jgi:hypothetical protein